MGRKKFCQILQCSLADSGIYTCDVGESSTSCSLEVYGDENTKIAYIYCIFIQIAYSDSTLFPELIAHELTILQDLEDLYIQEDQNAVFMCEVSRGNVSGEWYKDGHKIRPTSTIKTRTEGHFATRYISESYENSFFHSFVQSISQVTYGGMWHTP